MEEVVERAREFGYAGVELRLHEGEVIRPDMGKETGRRVRALFAGAGVAIVGIGASTRFAAADERERRKQEDDLVRYVELAVDLGAPMVRTFGGAFAEAERDGAIARTAESIARVAERTAGSGVVIALETHDGFSASATVRAALAAVDSPAARALWDTHHPVRMGETPAETFANLADRLYHVHLKDARRVGEDWGLVAFGEGDVPVRDVVFTLLDHGYDGWYCVEWERKWHPEIAPAQQALPRHGEILRDWINEWVQTQAEHNG